MTRRGNGCVVRKKNQWIGHFRYNSLQRLRLPQSGNLHKNFNAMFGLRLKRVPDEAMEPLLPDRSLALFRRVKKVKRSDIVLVDHPEAGVIVRKVPAISLNGRVGLRAMKRAHKGARNLSNVDRDRVLGKLVFRMNWVRFLPRFSKASSPLHQHDAPQDDNALHDLGPDDRSMTH